MKTPIIGGSYTTASVNAADNRLVNLFPEKIPEGGKEPAFLSRTPGLRLLATIGTGPIRGMWQFGGKAYVVSGLELYQVGKTFAYKLLGNVTGKGPVSMSDNGTQLFIACNPDGFIYNSSTKVFQQITDPDFPGAVTVGFLDGYFVFNEPKSQHVWVTSLLDGTAIDPLEYASTEGAPDLLVSLAVDHREVWLFGENSIEVWYNSGALNFPLERIQGAFIETGCIAAGSVVKLDNSLFWLGSDTRGTGLVFRVNGYTAVRVSNHAMETEIQSYGDLSKTFGFSYQQDGHSFLVLVFPGVAKTWVLDIATGVWHERAGFSDGSFTRHPANCYLSYANLPIVGDYKNGNIYAYDTKTYSDNNLPLKWLRSWRAVPTGQNTLKWLRHQQLQLDTETGVGIQSGQGSDPQVMLRWSDDGGHSWGNEHWTSMGAVGKYRKRAVWYRLGISRDRVYEVSGTDPVKVVILGAEIQIGQVL